MITATLAITGATGFIGRRCVELARSQGIALRAVVRNSAQIPDAWYDDPNVQLVHMDLTEAGDSLADALRGVRAVVHCAATLSGDQDRDTVAASVAVIDAVVAAKVPHVVLASSLSVYDAAKIPQGAVLNETSPVGTEGRDSYARAKQMQETLFQDGAALYGYALSTLRIGAVWGAGRLFNAHIGPAMGNLLVMVDGGGQVPLCQRDVAAEALLQAARAHTGVGVVNVVDDTLPTRRRFMKAFRVCGWPKVILRLPLFPWRIAAALTPDGPSVPGLLRRPILEARHRPLQYSNAVMHKRLGPVTMLPFEVAMQAAIQQEDQQAAQP